MRSRLPGSFIACVFLVALSAGAHPAQNAEPLPESIRTLWLAITPERDGVHLALLFGLRQLRDPGLEPFFRQLLTTAEWHMQVHAVLGLGELRPGKKIDTSLISGLAPEAQESVIATALDLEMLDAQQIPEVLAIDDLHPMARLFLLAEQVALNQDVDVEDLKRLSKSEDNHIAGLASALLRQRGDAAACGEFQSRLEKLPPAERTTVSSWLVEAVRRYKLTACLEWVQQTVEAHADDDDLAYRGVYTLLELDSSAGLEAWERFLGREPTYAQRLRYGLALLAAGEGVPASAFEKLHGPPPDEELITGIIAAGKDSATGADPVPGLRTLFDLGHPRTCEWAIGRAAELPAEQAVRVYAHLLDRLGDDRTDPANAVSLAVEAASKLHSLDAQAVLTRLAAAKDDSTHQQAILLGLFEPPSPAIGEAAAKIRRIGSGRADSLALILIAKHGGTLAESDIRQLGLIASGGGRVSEVLQIQAAWLYVTRTGNIEAALSAVFAKPTAETSE